ncbi:AAA family ATPase [Amycolatopsis rhabdoformis]|uniref:AAA family ATPase n=1 Tax=Amycolatopsis rhabdoformis TaxID=1448059 RepID=A0ABZ1I9G0_9PSEU|nr:AAA family ATPase [Amycolatopsis rhabdoformis]WSE31055.1 AAA family ATPase [Amycolatopsis rhabdoformis]
MLYVSLLGGQSISHGATGPPVTRSPRAIALVGYLVTHAGLPQPRQRLAALFWPDSSDAQARTNLRRELHHLRQVLGDEPALLATATDLSWQDTPGCRVDVRVFDAERRAALAASADEEVRDHAGAALAEYRGELMPGLADEWLFASRAELEQQCVGLCDLLGDAQCRLGDLAAAAETARRRIRLRPLEEPGYRTLMELQADLGDRAGAVSTYHLCAAVLERELGVAPDRATQAMLRRLLAEPPPGHHGGESRLVGRTREFAQLRGRWQEAARGRPSVALVRGDAGVGKTRLVVELARLARSQGAVVAGTQCFGTSGRLALAPVADWLRNPVLQPALAALAPVWRTEVDRLVPAGKETGPAPVVRAVADAWQRHRFFEGLARALTGAGRPTLLVLDNAQWCDQETLAFLIFCLGLEPRAPLLLAATQRSDPADTTLAGWTDRLRATGRLSEVELTPLDLDDTARLAESVSGRAPAAEELTLLHVATGGFPLSVVEALRSGGPPGDLDAVLAERLRQPTPEAREIAGLAAAVGRDFSLDLLTEASDLDAEAVVRAVDELWRLRILREFREGYDFSHDLLRDAAYRQVTRARRWLLHRRLAQSLELLHPGDTGSVSAQLAEQYARGGRPDRAVAFYRRAAELAAGTFAHGEAIRLLREALSLLANGPAGPETDRRELAVLEALSGPLNARFGYASPDLQRTLERSIELSERLGQQDSTIAGLVGLWTSRFVQGRTARAHEAAKRALELVGDDRAKDELNGSAHFAFAGSSVSLGRPAEALHHFDLAARLTRGAPSLPIGTRPEVHSPAWAAHAHWLLGHEAEAQRSCRTAVDLARTYPHPYSLAVALAYAGITQQMCGDLAEVAAVAAELRELCDRYGFAYYREWGLVLGGWTRGDADGLADIRRGVANLKAEGSLARMPYWLALQADLLEREGRTGPARAALDAALVVGQARDDLWWLPEVLRLRSAYDRPEQARIRLKTAVDLAAAQGSTTLRLRCERDLERR